MLGCFDVVASDRTLMNSLDDLITFNDGYCAMQTENNHNKLGISIHKYNQEQTAINTGVVLTSLAVISSSNEFINVRSEATTSKQPNMQT